MNHPAVAGLPLHAQDAATIEPGTHILMRTCIERTAGVPEQQDVVTRAIDAAAQITDHGGLISSIGRPSATGISLTALLTIRQAVELLLENAHTEVDGLTPPTTLFVGVCCAGGGRVEPTDPLGTWLSEKDEEARSIGVRRLELLIVQAGYTGDVSRVADELWTRCGF